MNAEVFTLFDRDKPQQNVNKNCWVSNLAEPL